MSKRRSKRPKPARFGKVHIGWKKHNMLLSLERAQKQDDEGKLDEKAKQKLAHYTKRVKTIIPKQFLRRYQIR